MIKAVPHLDTSRQIVGLHILFSFYDFRITIVNLMPGLFLRKIANKD